MPQYHPIIGDDRAEQAGRYMLEHGTPHPLPGQNVNRGDDVDVTNFCRHLRIGPSTWSEYRDAGLAWMRKNQHRKEAEQSAWHRHGMQNSLTHVRPKPRKIDYEAA